MPRAATNGRNTGGVVNPAKVVKNPVNTAPDNSGKRLAVTPQVSFNSRPQLDVLDHGLEDNDWHYVWVNPDDPMRVNSYWLEDYRFVIYQDVEDQLKSDERREYLYRPDVSNRVMFNELRLMRLPQSEYRRRINEGLGILNTNPAERVTREFESKIEQGKYSGELPPSARVNSDADSGTQTSITVQGEDE